MHETADQHILERLLSDNDEIAAHNLEHFDELDSFVVNMMSAPGAGKTTLIARVVAELKDRLRCSVIEGDMVGELDADRLKLQGIEAFQISTGRACHLDAQMIRQLLHAKKISPGGLVFIENVGNLVCPGEFKLGEHARIVLLSVTEGDDKPYKYPVIFHHCDAVVFTKSDLLPHVDFDLVKAASLVADLNPSAETFLVSAKTGQGVPLFAGWLHNQQQKQRIKQYQTRMKVV